MTSPPADCILDASAVLAVLPGEPGHEQVREVPDHCYIHAANLAEAASKLAQAGVPEAEINLRTAVVSRSRGRIAAVGVSGP